MNSLRLAIAILLLAGTLAATGLAPPHDSSSTQGAGSSPYPLQPALLSAESDEEEDDVEPEMVNTFLVTVRTSTPLAGSTITPLRYD